MPETLSDRLRLIEDRIEISELRAKYFRAVDTHDWGLLESVFLPDATFVGSRGVNTGTAEMVERVRKYLGDGWSSHHGHSPELKIAGDSASGVWAMEDYVGLPSGEVFRGYGHYTDTYVRTPDGWRIARSVLTRIRMDWLPTENVSQWITSEPPPWPRIGAS